MNIQVPVSVGELIDKITILSIKLRHIRDPEKLRNISFEISQLNDILEANDIIQRPEFDDLYARLVISNQHLWDLEDRVRELMSAAKYDDEFVNVATSIHHTNDERSRIKREINLIYNSAIVDEKSYKE
jgi:hypothetical protein